MDRDELIEILESLPSGTRVMLQLSAGQMANDLVDAVESGITADLDIVETSDPASVNTVALLSL